MSISLKSFVLCCGVFTLLLYWGFNLRTNDLIFSSSNNLEKLNDLHVTHLNVAFFDAAGHRTHALKSPGMEHVPYQNTYRLLSPKLIITQPKQPQWVIRSEKATAIHRGQEIILSHHVMLEHAPFQTHPQGVIKTEELRYYPKKNYAMTDLPITWKQQENHVLSQGMKAYLDDNRIELFKAEAIYEPTA